MDDSEILNIVRLESADAESYINSEISEDREEALKSYLGEPYGDEVAGSSQVVTREVMETIEWAMPSILKVFAGGDDVVDFQPVGPEDEKSAEQATDYINYCFYNDNPGFLILNTWFKDALIAKMGVVKSFWEVKEKAYEEDYSGLSQAQYNLLTDSDSVEVLEHTAYTQDGLEVEDGEFDVAGVDVMTGQPIEFMHDVKIRVTTKEGRMKTVNIPPEEFYISRQGVDPDSSPYLEHRATMTASDLVAMGFDRKTVESIPSASEDDPSGERQIRMGTSDDEETRADPAMRDITVYESYVFLDKDDSGIARRHKVLWAGEEILETELCEHQPFSIIQTIPIPHRAYGLSLADIVVDLQRIKTTIMRQTLNNLYLSNNPEREVLEGKVNIEDLMQSRPGGLKRVKQMGSIREIAYPFVAAQSFTMLDGIDSMISKRTGISNAVTGIDADVLQNETATASNNQAAAANQRLETICRIFAETGVKHLFKTYLRMMVKHQDKQRVIRLRNEWVEMDPRSWNAEMDVSIDVGLGHGNKDQQVAHLMNLMNWQKEMLASGGVGMVRPKHIYNTFSKIVKAIGFKSIEPFMDDPGDEPLPQPEQGQDPNAALIAGQMQIEQLKAQLKMAETRAKIQVDTQKIHVDHQHEMHKLGLEREKLDVEREKIAAQMDQTAAKLEVEKEKAGAQLAMEADRLRYDAEQKERDRGMSAAEKREDRMHQAAISERKSQKMVKMQRGPDGSMTGMVEE